MTVLPHERLQNSEALTQESSLKRQQCCILCPNTAKATVPSEHQNAPHSISRCSLLHENQIIPQYSTKGPANTLPHCSFSSYTWRPSTFTGHLFAKGYGRSKAYTKMLQNISRLSTVTSISFSTKAPKLHLFTCPSEISRDTSPTLEADQSTFTVSVSTGTPDNCARAS